MGKVKDLVTSIDFENVPTHTVQYDPNVETEELNGRNGNFDVIRVMEAGIPVYLSLSNQSLVRELRKIDKPSTLKLTREGTSFATKYKVEIVK